MLFFKLYNFEYSNGLIFLFYIIKLKSSSDNKESFFGDNFFATSSFKISM